MDLDSDLPHLHPGVPAQRQKQQISAFVKGGTVLMLTALIDMAIAVVTAHWATWSVPEKGEYGGYGLWKIWHCKNKADLAAEVEKISLRNLGKKDNGSICTDKIADLSFPAWYLTVQAFQVIGLVGLLITFILLLLYMFLPKWDKNKTVMSTVIGIAYLSGLCNAVALAVFGFKAAEELEMMNISEWMLSWSFSLGCTAFVLNQIAASILVTESKQLNTDTSEKAPPHFKPVYTQLPTKTEEKANLLR